MSGEGPPISTKATLDTSSFSSGVAEMNRQIRLIQSSFLSATASLEDWETSSEGLQKRIEALNSLIPVQSKKVEALRAEYERVSAEKGKDSRASEELAIKINKESASLGKMELELSQSRSKLQDLGNASKDAGSGMGDLEKNTGKAGFSLADLAVISLGVKAGLDIVVKTISAMATAVIDAGKAIVNMVLDSSLAAGKLQDLAAQTGFTTDQLQEYNYISGQVGASSEAMTGSISKLARSMGEAKEQLNKYKEDMIKAVQAAKDKAIEINSTYTEEYAKLQGKITEIAANFGKDREKLEVELNKRRVQINDDTDTALEDAWHSHMEKINDIQAALSEATTDFEYARVEKHEDTTRDLKRSEEDYSHDRLGLLDDLKAAEDDKEKARVQARIDELDYEYELKKRRRLEDAVEADRDAQHEQDARIAALQARLAEETTEWEKQKIALRGKQRELIEETKKRYNEELAAAFERYNGEAEAAKKAMGEIAKQRDEALAAIKIEPAELGPTAKAFQDLGVDIMDAKGQLRDVGTVWGEVITQLGNIPGETERDVAAMGLLGKSALEMNPIIKAGADEISRLKDEAHKVGAVVDDETIGALGRLDDALAKYKAGWAGFKMDLSAMLTGGKSVGDLADEIDAQAPLMLESGKKSLQTMLDGFIQGLKEPGAREKITQAMKDLALWISANMPEIAKMALKLTVAIAYVIDLFVVDFLSILTKTLVDKAVGKMKEAGQGIFGSLKKSLDDLNNQVVGIGAAIVGGVWKGIQDRTTEFYDKVKKFFQGLVDAVNATLHAGSPSQVFMDIGANAGNSYVSGLGAALKNGTADLQRAFGNSALALNVNGAGGGTTNSSVVNHNTTFNLNANYPAQSQVDLIQDVRLLAMLYGIS